ncbi:MAG: uracil-DNA glycosylase [bacterium]
MQDLDGQNDSKKDVKIEDSWKAVLKDEFSKEYFKDLTDFVRNEYKSGTIYPAPKNIFRSFELCPFQKTKVVIIGQDPYHGVGQANGLCFAVGEGAQLPPSLQNIFKEIESDTGVMPEKNGDLTRWAKQGVLLLNATLTVKANTAGSHQRKGWEEFTDSVIEKLSAEREGLVFILWGNYARKKGEKIDRNKHLVLEAQHPSPFSAYNGFFGCKHFSKANKYLKDKGLGEIDWR